MGRPAASKPPGWAEGALRRWGQPPPWETLTKPQSWPTYWQAQRPPLTKAFVFCGWQCLPVDWLIDPSHDLSSPLRQTSLHSQLQSVDCICAAMDCSTKSRAREIPRQFDDGRPAPRPLRSMEHPEGLPGLSPSEQARVDTDNAACQFVLAEIQQLADRGGISVRENPWRSLHWYLPQEQTMMDSGIWSDKRYSACCLMGGTS